MAEIQSTAMAHTAKARMTNLPISTKQSVEVSGYLRYKKTNFAKSFLESVVQLKKAVPYTKAIKDLGHKPGIGPGRFPQKAAGFFLQLVKSAEANAQFKGLDTGSLVITKLIANKAAIPFTGKRHRYKTKRTHIEIEVSEKKLAKNVEGKSTEKKAGSQKNAALQNSTVKKVADVKTAVSTIKENTSKRASEGSTSVEASIDNTNTKN